MFGINEKLAYGFVFTEFVHLILENLKMVFFGPVHGKSPQSAKLAQA